VVPEALAEVVRKKGGDVWVGCTAKQILVDDGTVKGAVIEKPEGEAEIVASVVISDAGPKHTVDLVGRDKFDKGYLGEVDNLKPSFQMWVTAISDRPLCDTVGLTWLRGRGVLSINFATNVCPELAPPGKHLMYTIYGPDVQSGSWDFKAEVDACVQGMRDLLPQFDRCAEVLHVGCYSGEWPVVRATPFAGFSPLSQKTPVTNLYNVGDGVGPEGWGAVAEGCAMTARRAADDVQKSLRPGKAS